MEKIYTNTRIRVVNGWLEVERYNVNIDTRCLTHIKLDRISHLTREGPFGGYDSNEEGIEVWHVNIHTSRASGDNWIKHTISLVFSDESEAETFLIAVNDKIY
jgi:hypothetical protein